MKHIIYHIALLTIILSGCKNNKEEAQIVEQGVNLEENAITISQEQFERNGMKLESLSNQNFPDIITASGIVDVPPQGREIISTFAGGYIKNSELLIGDAVKKGQALVTIENPDFVEMQQEYLEAAEQLSYLKNEYERQKTLFEEQITSQKKYLKAQSLYKTNLAVYNGLRKKLRMLNINTKAVEQGILTTTITLYASISGSITKINVSKGTYVSPSDVILEIVNKDHIHLELTVFEKDVMKLKKGQTITFKIPEASTSTYKAQVHLVGTSIDSKTRTVKVHGHLHDDENNNFAVGMFVDAIIEISSKELLAIPEDALVEIEGVPHILIVEEQDVNGNYTFKLISVTVKNKYNGYIAIDLENSNSNPMILTKGAFSLVAEE